MVKKIFLLILFLIFPISIFAHPTLVLNGPYGGKAEISCGEIYTFKGQDKGGECSVYYVNYSTIPGWKFDGGPLKIGFSDLVSDNKFWVDFANTSSIIKLIKDDGTTTIKIEIPEYFSFETDRSTLHCIKVMKYEGEGSPSIKVNGENVPVKPEFLHYFLHIFN